MTTFSRMDTALSYAMDAYEAGAIVEFRPFDENTRGNLEVYASDFTGHSFIGSYNERVQAGAEMHGYCLIVKSPDGSIDWAGDLHIVYWPLAPEAEPMFIVVFAA